MMIFRVCFASHQVSKSILLIPGTAAVVLAGLFGAFRITGKKLTENTYLFVGAGQVCLYIISLSYM